MKKFPITCWFSALSMVHDDSPTTRGYKVSYEHNRTPAYCLIVNRESSKKPVHHFLAESIAEGLGDADIRVEQISGPPTHEMVWFDTIQAYELAMEQYNAVLNSFDCDDRLRQHLFEYSIVDHGGVPITNAHHLELIHEIMNTFSLHLAVIETKQDCYKFLDCLIDYVGDKPRTGIIHSVLYEKTRATKKYNYAVDRLKRELGENWREYCMDKWGIEYENSLDFLSK